MLHRAFDEAGLCEHGNEHGDKNSPTITHACRKRRLKWIATLPVGDINTETWSSGMGVGRGANNPTL
jgi:hypothetical protein